MKILGGVGVLKQKLHNQRKYATSTGWLIGYAKYFNEWVNGMRTCSVIEPLVSLADKEKANEEDNDSAKQQKAEEAKPAADSQENKKEVTDERKQGDSIKGE